MLKHTGFSIAALMFCGCLASARPAGAAPLSAGELPFVDKGNKLWFVPLPLAGSTTGAEKAGSGQHNARGQGHLIATGPLLDVLWSPTEVRFWQGSDAPRPALDAGTVDRDFPEARNFIAAAVGPDRASHLGITDVQWDGKRAWVAFTWVRETARGVGRATGIAVIEADGKTIHWIGVADGMPPAEKSLKLHALSEGRVVAAGSSEATERAWYAVIDMAGGRPHFNVFHRAAAPPNPTETASTWPEALAGSSNAARRARPGCCWPAVSMPPSVRLWLSTWIR